MGNTALQKARKVLAAKREAGIEVERLTPAQKAERNPKSLRLAVNAKCWDCQGGTADPGIRDRIGACQIVRCALNSVRPYQ